MSLTKAIKETVKDMIENDEIKIVVEDDEILLKVDQGDDIEDEDEE
tara:strand:- start:872 stop:1009 length:138 start_codon:yes stop_codon:yes gene_type:complete